MAAVCYGRSEGYWTWYVVARLAVNVIFLIVFLLLTLLYLHTIKKKYAARQTASWYGYGLALLFQILSFMLSIIDDSLYACAEIFGSDYVGISIAVDVLENLAYLWILGIILLPLTLNVLRHARQPITATKWAHGILMMVLFVLMVAGRALISNNVLVSYISEGGYIHGSGAVVATFALMYFLASVGGTFVLLRARSRLSGMQGAAAVGLSTWLPFALIFQILSALVNVIVTILYSLISVYMTTIGSLVISIISNALSVGVYLGVLMCAASPALTASGPDFTYNPLSNTVHSKYDPVAVGQSYDPVLFSNNTAYKADPEAHGMRAYPPHPRNQAQMYEFPNAQGGVAAPQQAAARTQGYTAANHDEQRYEPMSY